MMNDSLANALSNILSAQKVCRKECIISPTSAIIKKVFEIMQQHHYVGDCEIVQDKSLPYMKVNLLGTINKCKVIKPRFSVKNEGYEKFEKRYLPAKDIGIIIVSTPQGIMTHLEAKKKNLGGSLLAYIY